MAAINDLIARIQDPELRLRMEKEVKELTKHKKFGLVFENHVPEMTLLYDYPISRGCKVIRKVDDDKKLTEDILWEVVCVSRDVATCRHTVTGKEDFAPAMFGIPSPRATLPVAKPTARTLCILPGLAAGRDGSRLGYGGGFYDRFLATFEGITVFPIYDCLLFDSLPTEATDRPVDILITEKGE